MPKADEGHQRMSRTPVRPPPANFSPIPPSICVEEMVAASDHSLVSAAVAGQLDAFDELMRRYERLVFKAAYGFGRNRENALDITQQVFLKAYRGLKSFREDADLKTWLLRITYHEGINWTRERGRSTDRNEPLVDDIPLAGDQEQRLLADEREKLLASAMAKLNQRHRTAIELRYRQGLPISEIATVLQCSEGVAKNMLFRGVRTLRQALGGTV